MEVFGLGRVLFVNLDSVSGGELFASPGERNFMGALRCGDPGFARDAVGFLHGPRLTAGAAASGYRDGESEACLLPSAEGGYGYKLAFEPEPLPACTDMTGFCSVAGLNRLLRAFTIVSRDRASVPRQQPRDYRQPSDTIATLFLASDLGNFGTSCPFRRPSPTSRWRRTRAASTGGDPVALHQCEPGGG